MLDTIYCKSLNTYSRLITETVSIGDITLGGGNPIRIQSMTNTDTLNTAETVEQCRQLIDAGCELVRITAPGIKEAENLGVIKEELFKKGYSVPLIADIHYNPKAAEIAAEIVEKVRINPGNYIDRKQGKASYSDKEYREEIQKIHERMLPLLEVCKKHGTAIRIGTNHGSLSDRIMLRYGNTPAGMVASAMEFVQICEDSGFQNIVLSMKSSDIKTMVFAYRLLVNKMMTTGRIYPLHLGVTEAGAGEDGIIKSAAGIGTLLEDGIGDTLRVSLTGNPVKEIPVATILRNRYQSRDKHTPISIHNNDSLNPFEYKKRESNALGSIGDNNVPVVVNNKTFELPQITAKEFIEKSNIDKAVVVTAKDLSNDFLKQLSKSPSTVLIFDTSNLHGMADQRAMFSVLHNNNCKNPVVIRRRYSDCKPIEFKIWSASDIAALFIDGLGDGVWLEADGVSTDETDTVSYAILQAVKARITKTEYISCPTCGRTKYDIDRVSEEIRKKTSHLKHLKIGVMGCVVNGPGEMADADYGVVGSGKNKVNLYKGKELIKKNINEEDAADELTKLIRSNKGLSF